VIKPKDIAVYGSGFASLLLSCNLIERGFQVHLINPKGSIGGVLNPISMFGEKTDIGPQFMENLNSEEMELIGRYVDLDLYKDIGVSHGSFYKLGYSTDFGVPDLTFLPNDKKQELIKKGIGFLDIDSDGLTLQELIEAKYGSISDDFVQLSNKFLGHDASTISAENYNYLEFGGRLRIYDDKISAVLKEDPQKDKILAVSRNVASSNSYSLYPKNGPLGHIVTSMYDYFVRNGGQVIDGDFELRLESSSVVSGTESTNYDLLFVGSDHLTFLNDHQNYSFDRPCLFHYFRLASRPKNQHYYYMNYDNKMLHTRVTHYFNYQNATNLLMCIEQPVDSGDIDKTEIERFRLKVLSEYENSIGEIVEVVETKSLLAPKTWPIWKLGAIAKITEKLDVVESKFCNIKSLPIQRSQRSDAVRYCLNLEF
jgi:hypothetical protein